MNNPSLLESNNNHLIQIQEADVASKIAIIRGNPVIADADVAELFDVETRRINEAVKNNPNKFPKHYMFELTKSELRTLRSKISTTKVSLKSRSATKVFTERGLYMLATILKSEKATDVTDKQRQASKMKHFGEVLSDIVMPELNTSETESTLELNFIIGKLKHTVKRVKKE